MTSISETQKKEKKKEKKKTTFHRKGSQLSGYEGTHCNIQVRTGM